MNNGTPTSSTPLETMIGQMIMIGFQGSTPTQIGPTLELVRQGLIGGVILYDENMTTYPPQRHNIRSPRQIAALTAALQEAASIPLFIAIDQEGGQVNRLKPEYGFPLIPAWGEIGTEPDIGKTGAFAEQIAKELHHLGINLNLAPVLDLATDSKSFMVKRQRCFSDDPEIVSQHAGIFIEIHQQYGILTAGKHFPGQGSALGDTHNGLVDVTEKWSEQEMIPYQFLVKENRLPCIMTSHIMNRKLDPDYPATLSKKIISGVLRETIGFEGVVISDDPQMKALANHYSLEEILARMLQVGVDCFCFGNNLTYNPQIGRRVHRLITKLVSDGLISERRIRSSYRRIMTLKQVLKP